MRGYRHRGTRDVFMFPSSSGGYKNSTWLKLSVRGLLLFLLPSFSSCVMSFLGSSVLHHLSFCPFFLHFPFSCFFPPFSPLYPLSSPSSCCSSLPLVLGRPHVAGLSWRCEPRGRPWLQADAQFDVCARLNVCPCVCG